MSATDAAPDHPRRPQARRRPLRLRAVEGPSRAARAPRRRRGAALMGTSHRQKPVKALVGRVRDGPERAVLAARGLRGGARQRRHHRVLGRRGVRPGARARAAPDLRRVLARSSPRSTNGAPFLQDPIVVKADPGDAPAPDLRPVRRRRRLGAQRDLDRRDGRRSSASATALVLIDATSGAGGLPVDAADADVYYFAPQKCFAADGGLWLALMSPAAQERIGEIDGTDRWIPEFLSLATALDNSPQGPDVQHPGDRHAVPARRPDRVDARQRRPRRLRRAHHRLLRRTCTTGPRRRRTRRRSSPTRPSARSSSAPSTSTTRSTPPRWPRRCAPTGSSTPSRTASSAATSCASAMFPAIDPDDVKALTACIDYVVENL